MASPVLGIDLGTTNSVVAYADQHRVRVLRDDDGHLLTPSTVSFHPSGQILVGHRARERRLVDAENTIFSVKRLIGRPYRSSEVRKAAERLPFRMEEGATGGVVVRARNETYSLPEVSSFVLRRLRGIAEQALGQSCVNAVITVPANFNELQRMATRDAGRIAGLNVLRILNEPTAAALAYGYRTQSRQRIAVYDFGGGTFDVSILELSGDVIEVVATAGDTYLGGDDVDALIADRMAAEFLAQHHVDLRQDPQVFERVRVAGEWVKCQLSMLESAEATVKEVAYSGGGAPLDLSFRLTRSELDHMIFPLVGRTFDICEDALRLAGVRPSQLDGVILVGGQTRTPKVRDMVGEYFGMLPQATVDPDLVVAQGAALQGYALSASAKGEAQRSLSKTLSGPPSVSPKAAAKENLLAAHDASGGFDDVPTRVASHEEQSRADTARGEAKTAGMGDAPFDDLPTTVVQRDSHPDEELTRVGEVTRSTRPLPATQASRAIPNAEPATQSGPRASQGAVTAAALKSTLMGVGSKAPPPTPPSALGAAMPPKPPPLAAVMASARSSAQAEAPPLPVKAPGARTLAETPTAKATGRVSLAPKSSGEGLGPTVPKAARVPAEAVTNPFVVDDVTEDDLPPALRYSLRGATPVPASAASAAPAAVRNPSASTLADSPKAKAVSRASALPPAVPSASGPARASQAQAPQALGQTPQDPIRTLSMARLLASQGHTERALSIYQELLSLQPRDATLQREIAELRSPVAELPATEAVSSANAPETAEPLASQQQATATATATATAAPALGADPEPQVEIVSESQFPAPARMGAPLLLLDVTPHTLCVETAGGFCEQIIERNAPIPTEQTRIFSTSQDHQDTVSMRICQGEARRIEDNQVLGQLQLLGLRPARRGEVSIAVTFILDADGTLNVKAQDRTTGTAQALQVSLVGALAEGDISRMRARAATRER